MRYLSGDVHCPSCRRNYRAIWRIASDVLPCEACGDDCSPVGPQVPRLGSGGEAEAALEIVLFQIEAAQVRRTMH